MNRELIKQALGKMGVTRMEAAMVAFKKPEPDFKHCFLGLYDGAVQQYVEDSKGSRGTTVETHQINIAKLVDLRRSELMEIVEAFDNDPKELESLVKEFLELNYERSIAVVHV